MKQFCIENDLIKNINFDRMMDDLDDDYGNTVDKLFEIFFSLMKKYDKNSDLVEKIINIIDEMLLEYDGQKLNLIVNHVLSLRNKVNNLKGKQRKQTEFLCFRLNDMLYNHTHINNKIIKHLEYLIFRDKNLVMIESFIKENSNILDYLNSDGESIFDILLKKYSILFDYDTDNINYYFQVVLLFIRSRYGNKIICDRDKYLELINSCSFSNGIHIRNLKELFDFTYSVTLEELEEEFHIKFDFPNIIIEECRKMIPDDAKRYDFTYQQCITMDGKNSLCLDDAIYIERNLDGTYTLYVHITDIPSFVPYNSLVNEEARLRVENIYLRDRDIQMYPDIISNNICSLEPFVTKNVITYIFTLDSHYNLLEDEFQFVKGVISVAHKMTYEEVDERVKNFKGEQLDNILFDLVCFAEKRRKLNVHKELYRDYENTINAEVHHESMMVGVSVAANIVHESMILVNYRIAKFCKENSIPYVYRKVFLPSDDFIREEIAKIKLFDKNFKVTEKEIPRMKFGYVRGMYSDIPVYHKGLKLDSYSHSTSPGRRYADSYCQYAIHDLIFDGNLSDLQLKVWEYRTKQLVEYLNKKKEENELFSNQYNYLSYKKLIKTKK